MKFRIPKIALCLAFAVPVGYASAKIARTATASDAIDTVLFYADVPARISQAVTNFKMLPERMNPTCSECN